jgi:hypothetical protein
MSKTTIQARLDLEAGRFTLEKSTSTMNRTVARVGFWAALVTTVMNVLFMIGIIAIPATQWLDLPGYASAFKSIEILPAIPSLLLCPAVVILMLSIHFYAAQDIKILSLTAVAFAIIYAALCSLNYFVQITTVRHSIAVGDTNVLAPFIMANPGSVMLAIDTLGYSFLFLSTLFAAPVFAGNRLENAIRWLFVASGVLGLLGVLAFAIGQQAVYFIGLMVSGLPFLAATVSLAVLYYHFKVSKAL